jgi:hypothetical protein
MKWPTDCPTAISRLFVHPHGPFPYRGVSLVILAAVQWLDAEMRVSRAPQPKNRGRQMAEAAGAAIPIFAALGRQRKKSNRAIILGRIATARQLTGGRRRAMRGEVILMGVRLQVIQEEWAVDNSSHSDQKFSKSKTSYNSHINCFLLIRMVWYKILCLQEMFHRFPIRVLLSRKMAKSLW